MATKNYIKLFYGARNTRLNSETARVSTIVIENQKQDGITKILKIDSNTFV